MYFCIRDDDTSFFTSPDELEQAYGEVTKLGPVSLAVVPYCRAGTCKAVPEKYRGRWSIHPLHENRALVAYLTDMAAKGRFEIMLHGYYHDEQSGKYEFSEGEDLVTRVHDGRKYLEDLLCTTIKVFVPPHNTVGRQGLRAIAQEGLHLGGTVGIRSGWPLATPRTWYLWARLRRWSRSGGLGVPWVLDLGDHHEIAGTAVTPTSPLERNMAIMESAKNVGGVFCAATHYWELDVPSSLSSEPTVGEHLRCLIDRARSDKELIWQSVGEVVSKGEAKI